MIIALLAWLGFCPGLLSAATEADISTEETEVVEAQTSPERKAEASTDKWGKFLPLPIFVTEPAIGQGLGAALIYFHRDEKKDGRRATTAREFSNAGKRSKPPPTATGIFGAYTNSDTKAIDNCLLSIPGYAFVKAYTDSMKLGQAEAKACSR